MRRSCYSPIKRYFRSQWLSFIEMVDALGVKLCLFIVLSQHMIKGLLFGGGSGGVVGLPILFLFKSYTNEFSGLNAIQIQIYKSIALSPWSLKPVIGIISDTVSLTGYHKLPWIFGSLVVAAVSCLTLAISWPVSPEVATCLLFFIFLACSTTDLLTESRYSQKIAQNANESASITTFVWLGIFVGQVISTVPIGVLLEFVAPHFLYYIPVLPLLFTLYPVYYNWLGDRMCVNTSDTNKEQYLVSFDAKEDDKDETTTPAPDMITNCCGPYGWFYYMYLDDGIEHDVYTANGSSLPPVSSSSSSSSEEEDGEREASTFATPLIGIKMGKIRREWRPILLAICIAIISIGTSILGILQVSTTYICGVSLIGSILMIVGFNVLIGGVTARIQTYVLLQNMFNLSISSAEFFFMTDTVGQYPEGPHFSKSFYVIAMGIMGSVCAILGSLSYVKVMQHWKIRWVFYFGNIFSILVGLLNVAFYLRWNKAIGIPDEVFVLGADALQTIVSIWCSIPVSIMMSKLCTKDMESIMYALLAGSSNLGNSLSQYTGATLLSLLSINPSGAPAESLQFKNLWIASLISTLLPVVTIFMIPLLIPDKYQSEDLLEQTEEEKAAIESFYITVNAFEDADRFIVDESSDDSATSISLHSSNSVSLGNSIGC